MSDYHWSVHTLAWNDPRYFFDLLSSLEQQAGISAQCVLIEHSHSGVLSSRDVHPQRCVVLRNAQEKSFGAAHQQATRYALSRWGADDLSQRYVALVHPDVILEPHGLWHAQQFFETHADCQLLLPKALRAALEFSETGEQREVTFQDEEDAQEMPCLFVRASHASQLLWKKAQDMSGLIGRIKPQICSEAVIWHHNHPLPPPSFSARVRRLWTGR